MKTKKNKYNIYEEFMKLEKDIIDHTIKASDIGDPLSHYLNFQFDKLKFNSRYKALIKSIRKDQLYWYEYLMSDARGEKYIKTIFDVDTKTFSRPESLVREAILNRNSIIQYIISMSTIISHLYELSEKYPIPCEYLALKNYGENKMNVIDLDDNIKEIIINRSSSPSLKIVFTIYTEFEKYKDKDAHITDKSVTIKFNSIKTSYESAFVYGEPIESYKEYDSNQLQALIYTLKELEDFCEYVISCYVKLHKRYILYPWNKINFN